MNRFVIRNSSSYCFIFRKTNHGAQRGHRSLSLRRRASLTLAGLTILATASCFAKPLVEQFDGMEVNWGQLKIRAAGQFEFKSDEKYSDLLTSGFSQILLSMLAKIEKLHGKHLSSYFPDQESAETAAKDAADQTTRRSYIIKHDYYTNGIQLVVENSLAYAARLPTTNPHSPAQHDPEAPALTSEFSGVILDIDGNLERPGLFTIVDENQDVLFTPKEMHLRGYQGNLMGRVFTNSPNSEMQPWVGRQPLKLPCTAIGPNKIQLKRELWDKHSNDIKALLPIGKTALNTSATPAVRETL